VAVALAAAVLHVAPPIAAADSFSDDLTARRAKIMERLGPDAMLVLFSAPVRNSSLDVDYEYRQDSNLYYLTGIVQDETMLVLMPGNTKHREILFIQDQDPVREHWNGRMLSREQASARTGIASVMSSAQFEPFIAAMLTRRGMGPIEPADAAAFFTALGAGRGRVAMIMGAAGVNDPLNRPQSLANQLRDRYVGFQMIDATQLFTDLRLIKTPYERELLAKSVAISAEAQKAGMKTARPGAWEYEVEAAIEAVHRMRGALGWSYPSIVGSGPNATILHYSENARQMQAGELLLVDAACSYQYLAADITRTYPVTGTFSEAQKDLYRLVLQAQEEAMKAARPGATFVDIHDKAVDVLKAGLLKLGLIADASGDQWRMWFTHGTSHYLGLDVHDVGERTRPLQPGMAFVIEPGLYIRQSALDALPRTPTNLALIEKLQPAVTKYQDIGVRIEDAFLLEETGLRRLTAGLPRTIEEIEAFMRSR
jgi:Xaa-Pro aminopeptidase